MNIGDLRQYAVTYEMQNISQAANVLFVTHQSLSRRIRNIEIELGATLFDRTTSGLIPTEVGHRFYRYAIGVVNGYDRLQTEIAALLSERKVLHVAMAGICGTMLDVAALSAFEDDQDHYLVEYRYAVNSKCVRWLLSRDVDIVIGFPSSVADKVEARCIAEDKAVVLVSKQSPLAQKEIITIDDLADRVVYSPVPLGENNQKLAEIIMREGSILKNEVCNSKLFASFVRHDKGVALINDSLANSLARTNDGVCVKGFSITDCPYRIHAFVLAERMEEPGVSELLSYCIDHADDIQL